MDKRDQVAFEPLGLTQDAIKALREKRPDLKGASDAKISEILADAVLTDRAVAMTEAADRYMKAAKIMIDSFAQFAQASKMCQEGVAKDIQLIRDKRMALTTEMGEAAKLVQAIRDLAKGPEFKEGLAVVTQVIDAVQKIGAVPQHHLHIAADAINRLAHNA